MSLFEVRLMRVLDFGYDCVRCFCGIGSLKNGAADHDEVRAGANRLRGRGRPGLILKRRSCRTNAGNYQFHLALKFLAKHRQLFSRSHDSADSGAMRQLCQLFDPLLDGSVYSESLHIILRKAG